VAAAAKLKEELDALENEKLAATEEAAAAAARGEKDKASLQAIEARLLRLSRPLLCGPSHAHR
jgi:hypothetical protein